jgi:acetyl-CoA carboxylase biotin carboxyl carrier protein
MKKIKSFDESSEETGMNLKIDYNEINKLIKLLEEKNLVEFELEVEGFKIKLRRNSQGVFSPGQQTAAADSKSSSPAEEQNRPTSFEIQAQEAKNSLHFIASPMVGMFYRAPAPNAPPFIEIGEPVKKKQTLCIVEAMKLMNEIESDVDGVVKEIFVENGKPVEFGQKLFAVLPKA